MYTHFYICIYIYSYAISVSATAVASVPTLHPLTHPQATAEHDDPD